MRSHDSQTVVLHVPDRSPRHQSLARRGNDPSARKLAVAALCLSALMCVGVVVYTQLTTKATSENLARAERELAYFRRVLLDDQESSKRSNGSAGISEIFHRYKRAPKNKKNGGHRPGTTPDPVLQPSAPPYIHLFGKLTYKQYMDKDQILFRWDKADENPGVYAFDVEGDKHNGYYRIKVKIQGVYLVYAQVAVHGREYVNKPNECSHETVCTKPNGERKVLLGSLITQFERGGTYEEGDDGIGLRALDTKIHMGVFMLQKGDVLSVQIPKNCENMEYSMTPEHSYFGLAKLNQDINKPQKKGKKGR
ncbi:hypothetical protein BsWGS_09238 [Bradybaena similaris]